jgi:hypothetical protein
VLEISSNSVDGKFRRVDIHSLMIGDSLAHELSTPELHAALKKMGCPRISKDLGKQDVLFRYGVWLLERAEAVRNGKPT